MTLLATHVGSLPRPQQVVDFLFAREKGDAYDPAAFDACMAAAVVLSEPLRWSQALGVAMVLASVHVAQRAGREEKKP